MLSLKKKALAATSNLKTPSLNFVFKYLTKSREKELQELFSTIETVLNFSLSEIQVIVDRCFFCKNQNVPFHLALPAYFQPTFRKLGPVFETFLNALSM